MGGHWGGSKPALEKGLYLSTLHIASTEPFQVQQAVDKVAYIVIIIIRPSFSSHNGLVR